MDFSAQHHQPQPPPQPQPQDHHTAYQGYDPSQIHQTYDQSTQAPYYPYQYDQTQYPYYTQQYQTNAYEQPQPQASIHPPGVSIAGSDQPTAYQQAYYPVQGMNSADYGSVAVHGGTQPPQIVQSTNRGAGRGHRPFRGRGRGRGRGSGRGRGIQGGTGQVMPPAHALGHTAPALPPPPKAWCELCRVDCNTPEILEQHKNGKKHKKSLQSFEELQKLNKLLVGGQNSQTSTSQSEAKASNQPDKAEGSNLSSETIIEESKVETQEQKVEAAHSTNEAAGKPRSNRADGPPAYVTKRQLWLQRRGAKRMKSADGSKREVEARKPKEVIPLICELCNVKCDTAAVFQTHLGGKKHLSKAKRFQQEQAIQMQAGLGPVHPGQTFYNANGSTSLAHPYQPGFNGLHQPGFSIPAQEQGLVLESASNMALPPPAVVENKDQGNLNLQGSTSEDRAQIVTSEEARSNEQTSLNSSVPGADNKVENIEGGNLDSELQHESTPTGSELVTAEQATDGPVAIPETKAIDQAANAADTTAVEAENAEPSSKA